MTFQGSIQDLQTAEVVDQTGDKVGKVGQVYLTNDSQEPSWVTVNTGLFGTKETFIPLAEASYVDGVISVPYEKSFIKDAPHIDEDGEISREEEDELYRYYGVADDVAPGAAGRREERQLGESERDLQRGDRHRADADAQYAQGHDVRGNIDERLAEHDDKSAARHADRAGQDALGHDGRRAEHQLDAADRDLDRGDRHQADADAQYAQGHDRRGNFDERLVEHDDKSAARHVDRAGQDALGRDGRREEHELDAADRDLDRGVRHQADADAQYAQGHDVRGDIDERLVEHDVNGAARHADRADRVETGGPRLRKYVVTETEQVEVPVRHEEVVIDDSEGLGGGDHR